MATTDQPRNRQHACQQPPSCPARPGAHQNHIHNTKEPHADTASGTTSLGSDAPRRTWNLPMKHKLARRGLCPRPHKDRRPLTLTQRCPEDDCPLVGLGVGGKGSTWPLRPSGKPPEGEPNLAWRLSDSNRSPPACKAGALPDELSPRSDDGPGRIRTSDPTLIKRVL